MPDPFSFEDFLAQQKVEYRASLPGRLALVETAWAAAGQDAAGAAEWKALERCAHALAGSAATFGLPAIGDAARALEESLEEPPQAADLPAVRVKVETVVELLREAIAAS